MERATFWICQICHAQDPARTPEWGLLEVGRIGAMLCPTCSQKPLEQIVQELKPTPHVAIISEGKDNA